MVVCESSNDFPIVRANPIVVDGSRYPHLKKAQENGEFDPQALKKLCHYGQPFFVEEPIAKGITRAMQYGRSALKSLSSFSTEPLIKEYAKTQPSGVFEFLDKLAQRNGGLGKNTSRGRTLGNILEKSLTPGALKGLNGERSLILVQYYLAQLKAQGIIRNFYQVDSPLKHQLADRKFASMRQCDFLDNCGIDILIEQPDGRFVPIQLKSSEGGNPEVGASIPKAEFEALQKRHPEKEFWYRLSHRERLELEAAQTGESISPLQMKTLNRQIFIKRQIPKFSLQLGSKEQEEIIFSRLDKFVKEVLKTKNKLVFNRPLVNYSHGEILEELMDKGYISILSPEEKAKSLERKRERDEQRRVEAQETPVPSCANYSYKDPYSPAQKEAAEEVNKFFRARHNRINQNRAFASNSRVDTVLRKFINLAYYNSAAVSEDDKNMWLKSIFSTGKISKSRRKELQNIERLNPDSIYTVHNFITLKKQLSYAYLKDHFNQGDLAPYNEVKKLFEDINFNNHDDIDSKDTELNAYKAPIPYMIWALQRHYNLAA